MNSLRMAREEMKLIKEIKPEIKFAVSKLDESIEEGGGEIKTLRTYWSKEEEDGWAPSVLRKQVEEELKLKTSLIPFNVLHPSTNGMTQTGGQSYASIGKSFLAGSPLRSRPNHQSKKSDSSFFPPISKINYNSSYPTSSTITTSPVASPSKLPSTTTSVYNQGRSPSMSLGHKRRASLASATATRAFDGTIQIEPNQDPFVSSSSEEDQDEEFVFGAEKAKAKENGIKKRSKENLTSTVCTQGMPHAFCLSECEKSDRFLGDQGF